MTVKSPLLSVKKQEAAVAVGKGTKTLDTGGLEKTFPGLMNPGSCCFMLMGGLGYGENHMSTISTSIHYDVSTLQAVAGGVMVWGVFS